MKLKPKQRWTSFLRLIVITSAFYALGVYVFRSTIMSRQTDAPRKNILNRIVVLNQMCREFGTDELQSSYKSFFKNIIVNDRYKIMFCYVPKVACSNFLRLLLWLDDRKDMTSYSSANVHILKKNLTSLGSFSSSGMQYRLKNYKKVIFVRDPLVRLISAFRNKFESKNPYFMSRYGSKIIRRYRNNYFNNPLNNSITFLEFLQYLIDERTIKQGYEDHWKSFNDLCHPCFIRYNFIGKYESIDQDVEDLLKLLDIQGQFKFPVREEHYKHAGSAALLSSSFKAIEQDVFEAIIKIYLRDYALFNYKIPSLFEILKN